ncbi:MAG: hypothetical protein ACE5KA_08490 [Nitrososphaerales archaeon]
MSDLSHGSLPKKGSITVSCRLDKSLYDLLQKDSKKRGISLNSLITSIMKRYINWEKFAEEIGYIPLARETVRLVFDNLDEKTLQTVAARVGRTIPREMTLLMFNKIDFDSIMAFLEITSSRYGMVQHNIKGDVHEMIVHHGVSKKFSTFLSEVGRSMAEDLSFSYKVINADSRILSVKIEPE